MKDENGWEIQIERGPAGLLVKAHRTAPTADGALLVDGLWSNLQKHLVYRLLLALDGTPTLNDRLIEQLDRLDMRIQEHGGMLRLCGLHERDWTYLDNHGLSNRFPKYTNRCDAVFAGDGPSSYGVSTLSASRE